MGLHWRVVIPLGPQGFNAGSTFVSGDPNICIVGIFCLTELETTQMKVGGIRPTTPKNLCFPQKAFVHNKQTSSLVVIVGAKLTTNNNRLKHCQQSTAWKCLHTTRAKAITAATTTAKAAAATTTTTTPPAAAAAAATATATATTAATTLANG
jgi:hypothetical protein